MSIFITHGNRLIDFANPQNSDSILMTLFIIWQGFRGLVAN